MSDLDRLYDKIEKIEGSVSNIDKTLAVNTASLVEHVRRTDLLEARVSPLEKNVATVHGALKLIGFISVLAGIAEGIATVLAYIKP